MKHEGLNLAHFWRRQKCTKISQNWTWIIQIWKGTLQSIIHRMKEEKLPSKVLFSTLFYLVPVVYYEGLNLAHFCRRQKWTKISRNSTWIFQIWKGTLQSVIYGMKEEKLLSKMLFSTLFRVVPVANYECLKLAPFWRRQKCTKISQNWMWIIQIWKESLHSVINRKK